MAEKLYLIDTHAQIYRAYYAPFRALTAPTGEPTKATYVFCQMLLNLIRDKQPDYLAAVIDVEADKVFRRKIDKEYKAHRPPMPEDLPPQEERILQILQEAGVPILGQVGFEADDIMATLVERLKDRDIEIYLASRDKDLEQLLSEKVRLYDPAKDEVIGPAELIKQKGYPPDKAIEVQALTGDPTDNIPGIPGVGPKTAARLINKYGTAEAVLAHADEQTPKLRENLRKYADRVATAKQLVTLRRDVPIDVELGQLRLKGLARKRIEPIFKSLGFTRLLSQLAAVAGPSEAAGGSSRSEAAQPESDLFSRLQVEREPGRYTLVDDEAKFREFLAKLDGVKAFAIDTETTGLRPIEADLVGLSFSWKSGTGYYIPVKCTVGRALPEQMVLERLRPILEDARIAKCGQNIKYDLIVLRQAGVALRGVQFDTMVASFLLDPTRSSHGINRLAREFLGHEPIPITELIGKGKKQIRMDQVDPRRVCEYAAEDADLAWRLKEAFEPELEKAGLKRLFEEVEVPLVEVLAAMEHRGVTIDVSVLAAMGEELERRLETLRAQIYEAAGRSFNVDSPKQLAEVLFDEQGLPAIRRTKTGRSTDASVLAELASISENPIPRLVLEYRELSKLKGTYVDTLSQMISPRTGRLHASFNQTGAVTGRLSSSDPNLQNIPTRTELGRQIRRAFVPGRADMVLLTADYSQIELRVLAHFCRDAALVRAFEEGMDIHAFVAGQVFGVDVEQVSSEQRSRAKAVNFGIIYGQGPYGLARQTGMTVNEAKDFIARYFQRYPGIRAFIDECVRQAGEQGYVRTILGRRRPIEGIDSRNASRRAQAERLAINTVIQGSAADLIKKAMVDIHRRIGAAEHDVWMLIQVHDELVFEMPEAIVEAEGEEIRRQMAEALPLSVPIRVDLAWGKNWLEAK